MQITIIGTLLCLFLSSGAHAWSFDQLPNFVTSEVSTLNSDPCYGSFEYIPVSGEGSITACVMGKDARVAMYHSIQGGVSYAVSFPYENTFYRLDVCDYIWGCAYAEQSDTFVGMGDIYEHFLGNLVKTIQNGVIHYQPNNNTHPNFVADANGLPLWPSAVAISSNGKWGLVEMRNYGIFRFNTHTGQMRRIIAPGYRYGLGHDPRIEMAISNDGATAAIMGMNMSIWLVSVNDSCGDYLNEFMQTSYVGAITPCGVLDIPPSTYIAGFLYASSPRFSMDDKEVSFYVTSLFAGYRHVTLYSGGHSGQEGSYVAVGDSFTSGEGETDDAYYVGGATNLCHVSSRSYPYLLSRAWNLPVVNTACSGATMDAARGKYMIANQPSQLSPLESYSPKVTTIGIGGNDAGLIGKLKDCIGLDTCKWAKTAEDRRSTALEIKDLSPRLKDFYKDVKARTHGPVIVVGYPLIISDDPACNSPISVMLNQTERKFMNEAVHYLNEVIRAAALDSGVAYADVEDSFNGGELCTSPISAFMNDIRIGDDIAPISAVDFLKVIGDESFHPKPAGHAQVANKILSTYSDPALISDCSGCSGSDTTPAPSSYWDSATDSPVKQRAIPFLSKQTIKLGDSFQISLPALSFLPSSDVSLQLHSDPKELGTAHANVDGSLQVTIATADFEAGPHSIHLIGQTFSGENIDMYDFLDIASEDMPQATGISVASSTGTTPMTQSVQVKPGVASTVSNQIIPAKEALGVSTVIDASSTPNLVKGEDKVKSSISKEGLAAVSTFSWLVYVGLGIACGVVAMLLYNYYQRKRSRYLNG